MTETAYWYFERFGDPMAVMRQGRQALPEPGPGQAVVALRAVGLNQAENRYLRHPFPAGAVSGLPVA